MNRIKYQIVKLKVEASNQTIKLSVDSNKKYQKITGVYASLTEEKSLQKSTLSLRVADQEIFPEDWEVKLLSSNNSVSPNARFFTSIDEEANGNRIDLRYTDGGTENIQFPYEVKLYFKLENKN